MFFEQDSISFKILDVLFLESNYSKTYNFKRNFDALSFRYEGDTVIEFNGKQLEFINNSIGFFPSDVDYQRISNRDKMIVVHFKTYNYTSNDIQSFLPADPQKYAELFEKIFNLWENKGTSYKHEASAILNMIFAELYKDNKKIYKLNSKIDASVEYIEKHYLRKDFSLIEAAEISYISDTYFRKLFKKEFGISPKQYVINRRIKYASSLIIAGYHTLSEISSLCGYNDYKHFSVEFKKIVGVSPSKYIYKQAKTGCKEA